MLDKILLLLGDASTGKELLIETLIDKCKEEAINYTHNDAIPDSVVIDMVIYSFNKLGTEGLSSESYSGVDFDYLDDYPESLKRHLNSFRKVMVIKDADNQ
jgi:hypothetical protein